VTEQDAKTKWCPFARVPLSDAHDFGATAMAAVNRSDFSDTPEYPRCIGSACMAWRWADSPREFQWTAVGADGPGEGWEKSGEPEMSSGGSLMSQRWARPRQNRGGYCGLAGVPQ
jgi:hypothetical protein